MNQTFLRFNAVYSIARRIAAPLKLLPAAALALLLGAHLPASTHAAEYPSGPISIICPFGAGGAGDLAARILANAVKTDFAKPVVVVNKPGAAGVLGTTVASLSKPDGLTLLIGRVANAAIIPALNKTVQYKWDSFVFLGLLDLNPLVFVVHKDSPYKTLDDLAAAAKAQPGKLTFCTAGALNIQEIAAYMFLHSLGLGKDGAVSVPFQSDAAGKNAILGRHVDFGAINLAASFDQLGEGGSLRALAVTTDKRLPKFPAIPTVREAGFPQLENILGWNALYGLKGMPKAAVDKWVATLQKVKTDKAWLDPTENMGAIPYILSPAETEVFVRDQVKKFEELGKALNLIIE